MTQRIDLMPASCRERFARRNRMRAWLAAYVLSAVAITVVTIGLKASCRPGADQIQLLDARAAISAQQSKEAARLRGEIRRIRSLVERHERIAWPVHISDVIAVVGQVAPPSVSIASLGVTPRQASGAQQQQRAAAAKDKGDSKPGSVLLVEIRGVAPNDAEIAQFVAGLESHPLFENVSLDYARRDDSGGVELREFGITCRVDAIKRYRFADAPESLGFEPEPAP